VELANSKRPSNVGAAHWKRIGERPERWERPGFGVIVSRDPTLWSFLPVCGHDHYAALSFEDAVTQAEERSGLCFSCWRRADMFTTGVVPVRQAKPGVHASNAADKHHPVVILVVEDDQDIRESLAGLLEAHGYSVLSAANGVEAFMLLRSGHVPSVILLDLMMPLMDGYRFRTEQRKDPALAAIPVVVITAGAASRDGVPEGVVVIQKPLEPARLLAAVDHCCHR
jgi:CheY-like chemotaxis protein